MSITRNFKIFVVEDDEWYGELLSYHLSLNPDFEVKKFQTGQECLNSLHEKPNVITLDYFLPDMDGKKVLTLIKEFNPDIEVIVISEQAKIDVAIDLLKLGAYDYIVKSSDIKDKLRNIINNIRKTQHLQQTLSSLKQEITQKYEFENAIIGQSEALKKVFSLLEKAAQTDITVTVSGETGTGKELTVKAIHYNSKRKEGPFITVNMAAIPKELAESELFGHEKGAFTGAASTRIGRFEEADGGTIFLDEIGEMEFSLQVKLLRVLQEKEITRIGSSKVKKIDCRVIVATNKNLAEEVKKGNFREDLYYRLLGLNIYMPPLRERDKDILILAKYFIDDFCKKNSIEKPLLSPEAQKLLMQYQFPGNVRELKSIIELAIIMDNDKVIGPDDITFPIADSSPDLMSEHTLKEYVNTLIKSYLKKYDNDVLLVAKKLDIGKSTIYRMLQEEKDPEI